MSLLAGRRFHSWAAELGSDGGVGTPNDRIIRNFRFERHSRSNSCERGHLASTNRSAESGLLSKSGTQRPSQTRTAFVHPCLSPYRNCFAIENLRR